MADQEGTATIDATIVIVTHNRKDELRRAVASALEQVGRVEVLVLDDASTDGTAEMMRDEFPGARYERVEQNVGYIVHRNRAADLARGQVLVSIDDDAAFSTPRVVEQVLQDFDDPRIGAVAIPYIDVLKEDRIVIEAPDLESPWCTPMFRGTAYAVRKEIFNQVGRFREGFRHQGEEADFCLRMLGRGYAVRIGRSDPIHHFESPKRVRSYIFEQSSRNWVINVLLNYPARDVPLGLLVKSASALRRGLQRGYPLQAVRGICRGFGYGIRHLGSRQPVPHDRYLAFQRMWRGAKLKLADLLPVDEAT